MKKEVKIILLILTILIVIPIVYSGATCNGNWCNMDFREWRDKGVPTGEYTIEEIEMITEGGGNLYNSNPSMTRRERQPRAHSSHWYCDDRCYTEWATYTWRDNSGCHDWRKTKAAELWEAGQHNDEISIMSTPTKLIITHIGETAIISINTTPYDFCGPDRDYDT